MVLPDLTEIEYIHSPSGQRIARVVDGVVVEKYLWSGMTTLLATFDGSGTLTARFLYAEGRLPIAMDVGASRFYLAYDQVGSLRAVIDGSGDVVKEIDYDAFGNIIADSNASFEVPFGFAGGLHDRDTGLVRFGYRDYDPEVGRWTAKDPIRFSGGDSNLYGYVGGDPVNFVDILGLRKLPKCTQEFLAPFFPDLDLSEEEFETERWPWWIPESNIGFTGRKRIFIRSDKWNPYSAEGVGLIAHELVHRQQRNDWGNFSFVMRWVIGFVASGFKNGPQNSVERPGYALEFEIRDYIQKELNGDIKNGPNPCICE